MTISRKIYFLLLKYSLKINSFTYFLTAKYATKLEGNGLHPKHRLMNYHQFFVDNVNSDDSVLDIGCGNGALTYDVAKKARNVTGIDLNPNNIKIAENNYNKDNIKYIHGDATKDLPESRFDVIILSNVLEHIEDRITFLNSITKLSNKILMRVPMINRSWIDLYKKELGLEYRLDSTHYIEYTYETFEEELQKANITIIKSQINFGEIWAVTEYSPE